MTFIKRIVDEETLPVVAGTPQFIHLSFAEYFIAEYFYKLIDNSQNVPCTKNFVDFLANQDGVRNFFFAMINAKSTENHLKFIKTIGDRAAFWSCQGDYLTLVSYLQQFYNYNKIRQNQPDWSWLFEDDEDEIVRQCCQLGVTALLGPSMLHTAVEHNAQETLQVLLGPSSRIDVNVRDYKKATPLHYAAKNGNLPIVQALISKGAKVNAADRDGYTALHIAAYEGHRELVRCLVVDHTAKVDCLSRFRETPGMLALKQKHTAIVELLEAREK